MDTDVDLYYLSAISPCYDPDYQIQVRLYCDIVRMVLQPGANPHYVSCIFPTWRMEHSVVLGARP